MNKLLMVLALGICSLLAAAQPTFEIFEFGQKVPAVSKTLSAEQMEITGNNWKCKVKRNGGKVSGWSLQFTSSQHDPIRLAIRFTSPLDFKAKRFWDGNREYEVVKLPQVRTDILNAFPLAIAEDGRKGRAVGFAPQTILSEFRRSLTSAGLVLETRIVVDDRRVQKIDIVDYSFLPEFGWRNAVEDYQKRFPAWFTPQPGIDQRIYGISGYQLGGHIQRPFQLHSQRYSGIQWEWTYAPWYESGNWFPAGDNWKGEKHEYWDYYGHRKGKQLTRKEYHDAVLREMHYGNKTTAMFYYILVKDIHQNVANSYPDAVQGPSGLHSLPSNAGKTKSVFAPGSKIFDYLKKQIHSIVKNYEVSGFSFDMANSSYPFFTESQLEYAVGRSWKDDGTIYTADTVAPIPFANYIHTLTRNNKKMGTIFNAADGYVSPFTFFHCDGAIIEGAPYLDVRLNLPVRLIMGRKPVTFWHWRAYPIKASQIAGNPQKKAEIDLAFKHFYLLKCYKLGFNFMNWVSRDAFFKPHIPVIRALSEAGYHPVSAVKGSEPFWVGRFGDANDTILTISNPKRETISRKVRVIHRYLGNKKYAFIPRSGKLHQRFVNGETELEITLAPKEVIVLRTVQVSAPVSELTVSVSKKEISFQGDKEFHFILPNRDFDGYRIRFGTDKYITGKCAKNIKLALIPPYSDFTDGAAVELMSAANTPAIEAGNDPDTKIAAEALSLYRPYIAACLKRFRTLTTHAPGFLDGSLAKQDLTVTSPGKGKPGKKICIGTSADFPSFTPPKNWQGPFLTMPDTDTLWIGGTTPAEVRQAALIYFEMLDKYQNAKVKVNFIRPSGWGGRATFVDGEGQKYLRLVGDPAQKNNKFYYAFYHMPALQGTGEITFVLSGKLEKLTSGKFRVGIYEFSDNQCRKTIRLQAVDVPVSADWQTITKRIKLHKNTKQVRFYVLGQNAGKGDTLLVRSLEFEYHSSKSAK